MGQLHWIFIETIHATKCCLSDWIKTTFKPEQCIAVLLCTDHRKQMLIPGL